MTANIFIYRAGIQAGSTTDAVEALSLFLISQDICTAIVEKDHIHFLWSICFILLTGTSNNSIINCYPLPCSKSCQQWPEQSKIHHGRNDLFNSCNYDMRFWPGTAKACVAFILSNGNSSDI